jgi:hypothetical protein
MAAAMVMVIGIAMVGVVAVILAPAQGQHLYRHLSQTQDVYLLQ